MSYWDNICEIQKKQTQKGIETYGQTLEENKTLGPVERITMLEEELIDALMYLEHLKALFGVPISENIKEQKKCIDSIKESISNIKKYIKEE